uniref:Uncharacterized protein n=1 Tax=Kalanchoe fedtschenkoi TaxID=63787 RepID=A0A7N1A737_KALFE
MENSVAMKGGDGPKSYSKNSQIQGEGSDKAKDMLTRSILDKLTPTQKEAFYIADLGCSVGPNTFSSIKTITEAVKLKSGQAKARHLEFQVFFNDTVANDFNTLFNNLPSDRGYRAAGVPGSFYGRLLPKASVDFFHSAFALNWMSKVPDQVLARGNKGTVTYIYSEDYVKEAYRDQFCKDLSLFLEARSEEMVEKGLMAVLLCGQPDGADPRDTPMMHVYECIGDALNEMVAEGLLEEALVDSFNIPVYLPTTSEIKEAVFRNKNLTMEVVEEAHYLTRCSNLEEANVASLHARAALEGIVSQHVGHHLTGVLFERLPVNLLQSSQARFRSTRKLEILFFLIRRIAS